MKFQFLKVSAFAALFCLVASTASAQQDGIDAGDIGSGTGAGGSLDAEEAFDQVERGDSVGSTGETGAGFSALSSGNGEGGGGGAANVFGGFGGFGGGFGGLGNLFGGAGGQQQAAQPILRTRLRSAVAVPPTPPAYVQQIATYRFQTLASRPQLNAINIRMNGRTAVLSGTVPTAADRRMSEMLMRLEPGVSAVVNQIAVVPVAQ